MDDEQLAAILANQDFDNEWIKFLTKLSKNQSTEHIVDYIKSVRWTDNQKNTLMHYAKIVLGDGLLTTFITESGNDWNKLTDDKALIDCNLTLDMTTFDITGDFIRLTRMIDMHFKLAARNSRGGFIVKRMNTHRNEIEQIERNKDVRGVVDKIKEKVDYQ